MLEQLGYHVDVLTDGSLAEEVLRRAGNLSTAATQTAASELSGPLPEGSGEVPPAASSVPLPPMSNPSLAHSLDELARPYDVVLMDIVMMYSDGADVTRDLVLSRGLHVPVIAMTGNTSSRDRERYRESGFWGILCKPFTRESMEEKLRLALRDRMPTDPELHGHR